MSTVRPSVVVRAYYNENDRFAARWLKELIAQGLIARGDVDERNIREVQPGDLDGYTQCHFFAGIGGWSLALRMAGWPDDRPVWTGSCPCQPFSSAGKGEGFNDPRHLWPTWLRLIRERRPDVVFGEQVASGDGLAWFDHVSTDLEEEAYAIGAADLCAAGVGAPHIRQRLYFVAHTRRAPGGAQHGYEPGREPRGLPPAGEGRGPRERSRDGGLADTRGDERGPGRDGRPDGGRAEEPAGLRSPGDVADADRSGPGPQRVRRSEETDEGREAGPPALGHGEPGVVADPAEPRPARSPDSGGDGGQAGTGDCEAREGAWRGKPEREGTARRVDDSDEPGREGRPPGASKEGAPATASGRAGRVAEPGGVEGRLHLRPRRPRGGDAEALGDGARDSALGDPHGLGEGALGGTPGGAAPERARGHWDDVRWVYCRDGLWRPVPVEPELFPLAPGLPGRVGILRGSGNSIVPQVAAVFIRAALEAGVSA